jgi:hypothetical protein
LYYHSDDLSKKKEEEEEVMILQAMHKTKFGYLQYERQTLDGQGANELPFWSEGLVGTIFCRRIKKTRNIYMYIFVGKAAE